MKTLVIGATNIDIIGISKQELISHESNIGEITISLGGVAKNIATNLQNLGEEVAFLTLLVEDQFLSFQQSELKKLNLDISHSFQTKDSSNIYLAIHGHTGDLETGINDMHAFELLKPADFDQLEDYINQFDVLVFDTNLAEATLSYLIERYQHKLIYVDGVSQTKVKRIRTVLPHIDLLKINDYEMKSLLNDYNCDIIKGVRSLLDMGLKHCLVSQANGPIIYNDLQNILQSSIPQVEQIKSTMGAGDALLAGTIYYLNHEKSMKVAIQFGTVVASKTLEVYESCNPRVKELINL